ncbi:ABC transporter substrate-binding protein [Fredinandcohnia onubensis]|uniref:ABC transporter substrate-binding protein n=1 Tax=Fredinandcohnia onubensis TaxID=1571209 RepID=UPI0015D4DBD0|nr:extracellular solute-binding protein [Fredinandcohnia onubensis]
MSNNDQKDNELVISALPSTAVRLEADGKAFMAEHPEVKIKINEYEESIYKEQAPKLFISSEKPDIAWYWNERNYEEIVESGALVQLDSLYKDEGWTKVLEPNTLKRYTSKDGHKYSVNTNIVWTPVIFYNKQAFLEAGVKVPETFDELFAMAIQLKNKGYIPLISAIGEPAVRGHIFDALIQRTLTQKQFNELILHHDDNDKLYQSKEILSTWKMMRRMANELMPENFDTVTEEEARALFVQGKAAMYSTISMQAGFLEEQLPENFNIGFFYYPSVKKNIKPKVQLYTGDALMVIKGTGKEELAKKFVAFVMSYERQKALAAQRMTFPSRTDIKNEDLDQYGELYSNMYREMNKLGTTQLWDDSVPTEVANKSFQLHLEVMTDKKEPIEAGKELQDIYDKVTK